MRMKRERDLIKLASAKVSVQKIAAKLKIDPLAVVKTGKRLGIYLKPPRKRDGRRKKK